MEANMTHTYKNKTNLELVLPDIGTVPADAQFTSTRVIENPNIERVEEKSADNTEESN
jgi:hypothetical protein